MNDKETDARRVFERIIPRDQIDRAVRDINDGIKADTLAKRTGSLRGDTFGLKPIVWIGIILSIFQQFVGINVIFYYSTTLWRAVGFQESDSLTISVITSVTNVLVTLGRDRPRRPDWAPAPSC